MVKFVKQSDISVFPSRCFSAKMSSAHKDVFDNSQDTVDIQDRPYKQGLILEIPTADTPAYGSGQVAGYKLGLHVNSISTDSANAATDNASIGIFKLKAGITKHEGSFGTTILRDVYSIWAGLSETPSTVLHENFQIDDKADEVVSVEGVKVTSTDPYITADDAWANRDGSGVTNMLSFKNKEEFQEAYGIYVEDQGWIIPLVKKMDPYEGKLSEVDTNWPTYMDYQHGGWNWKDYSIDVGWTGEKMIDIPPEYHYYAKNAANTYKDATNDPVWEDKESFTKLIKYQFEKTVTIDDTIKRKLKLADTNHLAQLSTFPEITLLKTIENAEDVETVVDTGNYANTSAPLNGDNDLRMYSYIGSKISSARGDPTPDSYFRSADKTVSPRHRSGGLVTNHFMYNRLPGPIMLHKDVERGADQEVSGDTNRSALDIQLSLKIEELPEIFAASATEVYFPSRGVALWFKNRKRAGGVNRSHIVSDIMLNHYGLTNDSVTHVTGDAYIQLQDSVAAATKAYERYPFCGLLLFKFNGDFYVKSLGTSSAATAGWGIGDGSTDVIEIDANSTDAVGGDFGLVFKFNPANATKLDNSPEGKHISLICRFKPDGNGFELIMLDRDNGNALLHAPINCFGTSPTATGTDYNLENGWPIMTFAMYNTASVGSGNDGTNDYDNFRYGYLWDSKLDGTSSEQYVADNTPMTASIDIDSIKVSRAGFNYSHLNNTFSENAEASRLPIKNPNPVDRSQTLTVNTGQGPISEEAAGNMTAANFWAFGFKNTTDLSGTQAAPKYLYFSDFDCDSLETNEAIDANHMKWAYSCGVERMGRQLWSHDIAGTAAEHRGSLSKRLSDSNTSSYGWLYKSDSSDGNWWGDGTTGSGEITNILNCEMFTQKGAIGITSDFSNWTKRENIFASARIIKRIDEDNYQSFSVDDLSIFRNRGFGEDEAYIIYKYNGVFGPTNYCVGAAGNGLKLVKSSNQDGHYRVDFNESSKYSYAYKLLTDGGGFRGTTCVVGASDDTYTFANAKIGGAGDTIDLRQYFNVGDKITVTNADEAGNNGDKVVKSVTSNAIGVHESLTTDTSDLNLTITKKANESDFMTRDSGSALYDDSFRMFISPYRYWLFAEIFNYNSDDEMLPEKSYGSVVVTDFKPKGSSATGSSDFGTDDFGATWNEYLITDASSYNNAWSLSRQSNKGHGALELETDFGYGAYDAETGTGGMVSKFTPSLTFAGAALHNIIDISNIIKGPESYEANDSLKVYLAAENIGSQTKTNISTFNHSTSSQRPFLLTVFEDELPAHPDLRVQPFEDDQFVPQYTWSANEDDLWYGLLMVSDTNIKNQYHNNLFRIPLNEDLTGYATTDFDDEIFLHLSNGDTKTPHAGTFTGISDRYDGLAGHSKEWSNSHGSSGSIMKFSASDISTKALGSGEKLSVLCHVILSGETISEQQYIMTQLSSDTAGTNDFAYYISLTTSGNIEIGVQGNNRTADTDVMTVLTSSSIVAADGETPTMICFTVDNELPTQNVKLYINGILESSSGVAQASTNTATQWAKGLLIEGSVASSNSEGDLYIGSRDDAGSGDYKSFDGRIEEIVVYDDVIYPVNPKDGEYLYTKPRAEFQAGVGAPTSYVARLFVKDYHNIRGTSTSDIATSPPVSFSKPMFNLRGD